IEERARLLPVAPDFDRLAVSGLGDLPAHRSRDLFPSAGPDSLRPEYVEIEPFRKQLFPAVFGIRRSRVDAVLAGDGGSRVFLVEAWIDAGRRRVENPLVLFAAKRL